MKTVQLGTTDLRVSPIVLGCMSLSYDRLAESKTTVRKAYELRINFFDTADIYGRGDSETILGEALREAGIPRDDVVIAQLKPFAQAYGVTLGQLSLAWLMQQPGPVIPLVGTANPEHIAEAAEAVSVKLDRDDWYEVPVIARGRPMPWGQKPDIYTEER